MVTDFNAVYRQVDTAELVSRWAAQMNEAEIIPDTEGKHLVCATDRSEGMVIADITVKTNDGADTIPSVLIPEDVWAVLPQLPADYFGDPDWEDEDSEDFE